MSSANQNPWAPLCIASQTGSLNCLALCVSEDAWTGLQLQLGCCRDREQLVGGRKLANNQIRREKKVVICLALEGHSNDRRF